MGTSDLVLPSSIFIRHKFVTVSVFLTLSDERGDPLYEIHCPSLRMKKTAYIYRPGDKRELMLWLTPVWGLKWNIMISLPNDEIIGVCQRVLDAETKRWFWSVLNSDGKRILTVSQEDSTMDRLMKKVTLFSSYEDKIYAGQRYIGSFGSRSGVLHENFAINLTPEAGVVVDNRHLLSILVILTGIFNRVFT